VKDQTLTVDELFATTVSRRKMLKMSSLLGLGVAGGWLLAACGDDDEDDAPAQPGTTPAPTDDDDDEDDETPEPDDDDDEDDETPEPDDDDDDDDEPTPGDTSLTVGLGTEPIEMDPHRLTANIDRQIQRSVFSGLTRWDLDMDPQPDLALSWEISDDQITWTFDLREGVLFHNGREMTAEDVKFSYERIFEIGAGGKYATYIREIESVEVIDDYTVELTLAHPSGVLLTNLQVATVVPEEEADNLSAHPVGTGPFRWVERIPNQHIRLEKNPDFYGDWTVDYVDTLTLTPATEEQTRIANLLTGEIAYSYTVPFPRVEEVEGESGIETIAPHPGSASYSWTLMHNQREPFNDVNARMAVAYGIDREGLLEAIYRGHGEAHWNPFPQNHWAHAADIEGPEYDLDRAREFLEQSSYNGEEIVYKIFTTSYWVEFGELVHAMLLDVGFNVRLEQLEFATWIEQVYQQHDFQIAQTAVAREWDPDGLTISCLTTGGSNNPGEYSNEEMDAAFERGKQAVDQDERIEAYHEVQRLYARDQPHVKAININQVGAYRTDMISEMNRDALGLTKYEFVVLS
jgi:peptide/nickel transport system substrate-binding protein